MTDYHDCALTVVDANTPAESESVVTHTTDEVTALCPMEWDGPDFYTLHARYVCRGKTVEKESFKRYLDAFRTIEATAESLVAAIHDDIVEVLGHNDVYLRLEQAPAGGTTTVVEAGQRSLASPEVAGGSGPDGRKTSRCGGIYDD